MFSKGIMKDKGLDITIKNNPGHVLSTDDWNMVLDVKFGKISQEDYKTYYLGLLKNRWVTRQKEFLDLARQGSEQDIILRCYCPKTDMFCHAYLAAKFMNNLIEKMKQTKEL
jgi:hypothetical protein